jgi:SAM-dependent methyltransferase
MEYNVSTIASNAAADLSAWETVSCLYCDSTSSSHFIDAEEDLTGKPGRFTFVQCHQCGLVYQNPRLTVDDIKEYYDDEYIAHRKSNNWGILTRFFNATMNRLDRRKEEIVCRHASLDGASEVLDVGCGAGSFLRQLRAAHGARISGVDFIDLSALPGFDEIDFRCNLFYRAGFESNRFDVVTMWHFLEHDYDPLRSLHCAHEVMKRDGTLVIEVPRLDSLTFRLYGDRWPGLQAPQHTVLFSREMLEKFIMAAGFETVEYLPYGAYPAYFYLFAGLAFKFLKGKGLNLAKAIYPYFLGRLLLAPVLLFERRMNLAMQTVICRKG